MENENILADAKESEPVEELLGSLTKYNGIQRGESPGQTVRTSARVFKKLRQDSFRRRAPDAAERPECPKGGAPASDAGRGGAKKAEKKSRSAGKRRMPKALWSTGEKEFFFEALNEYGKDFDAITAYICNKIKKKGAPDAMTKNKHQVSHFYYRTWQKVSKYVKLGNDLKKVVQELYALINYGEMRKRLDSQVPLRVIPKLTELVWRGAVALRAGGRTVRVRTPVCRALRRLNRLEGWEEQLRLPSRVALLLCPRDMEAWSRVHASAHNPRVLLPSAPSRRLAPLLDFLQRRWLNSTDSVRESLLVNDERKSFDALGLPEHRTNAAPNPNSHLAVNAGRIVASTVASSSQESSFDPRSNPKSDNFLSGEDVSRAAPKPHGAERDRPASDETKEEKVDEGEAVRDGDESKGPKRGSDADEERGSRWSIAHDSKDFALHVGPKPGTDFNIPTVNISEHLTSQRICLSVYLKRMGADAAYVRGATCKNSLNMKVKNHKRQRKDSGDNDFNAVKKSKPDGENWDKNDHFNVFDVDETANDGMNRTFPENRSSSISRDPMSDDRSNDDKDFNDFREKDHYSEPEDEDKYNNETDGEFDTVGNKLLKYHLDDAKKFPKCVRITDVKGNVKLKTKKYKDQMRDPAAGENVDESSNRVTNTFSSFFKKNWNRDILTQQVKKGWSFHDAGDLTVGDLYLMFGNESKLELNYWWTKGTPPFTDDDIQQIKKPFETFSNQSDSKDHDSISNSVEGRLIENTRLVDFDKSLLSPMMASNDADNDENKKDGDTLSPEKTAPFIEDDLKMGTFNLVTKIINNPLHSDATVQSNISDVKSSTPFTVSDRERVVTLSSRLKKLLSLSQLFYPNKGRISCFCGHVCNGPRGKKALFTNSNESTPALSSDGSVAKYTLQQRSMNKLKTSCLSKNVAIIRPETTVNPHLTVKNTSKPNSTEESNIKKNQSKQVYSSPHASKIKPPDIAIQDIKCNQEVVLSPQHENNKQDQSGNQLQSEQHNEDVFKAPCLKKELVPRLQPFPQSSKNASNKLTDFANLPKWTNRGTKKFKPAVAMRKMPALAPWPSADTGAPLTPQPIIKITPALPRLPQLRPALSNKSPISKHEGNMTVFPKEVEVKQISPDSILKECTIQLPTNEQDFKSEVTLFNSLEKIDHVWQCEDSKTKPTEAPILSNLLDISLPIIADENSIGISSLKIKEEKHDDYSVLESMSIPSMSPSQLLKENDDNWLGSDVNDFSLSSFLGHLESNAPSSKIDIDSAKKDSNSLCESPVADSNILSQGTGEKVDNQFPGILIEASVDYVGKFADLSANVDADIAK